ncbi:MAG: nucleoside transporter C-terminal domain-containing protein [Leptolyngbyaceae bacterium]|nr:nucleoside transporter C-terminal domain-containing protein [Leptolyngbyaceae bacterium]
MELIRAYIGDVSILNFISLAGIFGLCAIAWLFSENRSLKYFPWRVMIGGIVVQLIIGALVFRVPGSRDALQIFSNLLNFLFDAADAGANFVFGSNIVPTSDRPASIDLGYIFAFRALPTVIFFGGLMALLYNIGVIQVITNIFAKLFYNTMRLSGAESLSGAANIFVGIEAAIVVKPFLAKMTRSELCAILACCFGTSASSVLAIYVSFLRPVFPNILAHLVSASIIGIPACFVLSKILVPETEVPLTAGGIPEELKPAPTDEGDEPEQTISGEAIQKVSPLDAAIAGALDGVRMAVGIAAVLILILGFVYLINLLFSGFAFLPGFIESSFNVDVPDAVEIAFSAITLQNIMGILFLPVTILTGVSLEWQELWTSSVLIGRRLFETAIPSYQLLGQLGQEGLISDRAILIVSYALSGFAHLASVGIFVGGTSALIPERRRDISALGWKALFVGTLATLMISCVAGVFDDGTPGILGRSASDEPAVEETVPAEETAPAIEPATEETTPEDAPSDEIPSEEPAQEPFPTAPEAPVDAVPEVAPDAQPEATPDAPPAPEPAPAN